MFLNNLEVKEEFKLDRMEFYPNELLQHFKRDLITQEDMENSDYDSYKYLYRFIGDGIDTETNNQVCIYQAISDGTMFVRPKEMFYSKVDKEKYPNAKQEYRLEKYNQYEDKYLLLRWNDEELEMSVAAGVMTYISTQKEMKKIVTQKSSKLMEISEEAAKKAYEECLSGSFKEDWLSVHDFGSSIIYGSGHEERYQIVKWMDYNV